ncbi:MAG: aminoglycoside phosphotransferase family protein, partial [Planctomycetota bacterium]
AARAGAGPDAPQLAPLVDARGAEGVVLLGAVAARPLHRVLMREDAGRQLEATARALARLHALSAAAAPGLPPRPSSGGPEEWLEILGRGDPILARTYAGVARALALCPPPPGAGPLRVLHGDLHDKNVLVRRGRVWLLDLDTLCAGDPAADVGNLAGHLILRALQGGRSAAAAHPQIALLAAAYRAAGGTLCAAGLRAWTADTLFRLACLYPFRRRWRHLAEVLLQEISRWSDGAR